MSEISRVADLAHYLVGTGCKGMPESILERGRGLTIDQVGVSLVGARQPSYAALEALIHEQGLDGEGGALVLSPTGRMTNAYCAAFLNAASAHIAELGEGVSRAVVHVSNAVVPAALAEASGGGLTGTDLLRAVTLGCETLIRFGLVLNGPVPDTQVEGDAAEAYLSGWWTPTMLAPVGAATAMVLLRGGTAGQMIRAWSIALNTAPATTSKFVHEGAAGKGFAMGVGVGGGLMAAKLALSDAGDEREEAIVAHWPDMIIDSPKLAYLSRDLGQRWEIDFPLYKFFASVGPIQASLEATLSLVARHRIDPRAVESVQVEGYARTVSFAGEARPRTAEGAKASLLHHIATALVLQRSDVFIHEAFCEPILSDPLINSIAERVTPVVNAQFNAEYPFRSARGKVTVKMKDGTMFVEEVDRDKMSKYHYPTRDELGGKFVAATSYVLQSAAQKSALECLWQLERMSDVGKFVAELRQGWPAP